MDQVASRLRGATVGVIAFNARPIAMSLRRLGCRVLVSDYWGDTDLAEFCERYVAILDQHSDESTGGREDGETIGHMLVDNMLRTFGSEDIDLVFIGSGLDNDHDEVRRLTECFTVVGNDADAFRRARDPETVTRAGRDAVFRIPRRVYFDSLEDASRAAEDIGYPCVMKSVRSGGGTGIRLIRNPEDLQRWAGKGKTEGRYLQEYIEGTDVSCSVLSSGSDAHALSVQGQLIGMPSAGRRCDFVYCGNYIPVPLGEEVLQEIMRASEQISLTLGLRGSNGVDMVVDREGEAWLMEVNPRLQGSLEMFECSTGLSVTELHYLAWSGELPAVNVTPRPTVRMVVYANHGGTLSSLEGLSGVWDRTPGGSIVNSGDPICTVVMTGARLSDCYGECMKMARIVQSLVRPEG
ncbi:MAG: ATP-grasp domain-containing protein [Candidatus Thorarchaeota archaeon]